VEGDSGGDVRKGGFELDVTFENYRISILSR
jgi:hypothetical protein